MLKSPKINNKTPSKDDPLYNPLTESLTIEEISRNLDEFNSNFRTPISKRLRISDSPFIEKISQNDLINYVYHTPTTPFKSIRKKRSLSKSETVEKKKSPSFGKENSLKKENLNKSTAKFKCLKGFFFVFIGKLIFILVKEVDESREECESPSFARKKIKLA